MKAPETRWSRALRAFLMERRSSSVENLNIFFNIRSWFLQGESVTLICTYKPITPNDRRI